MKRAFASALVLAMSCAAALAQCCPGVIYGTVKDPSGAVVPGAKVTANCEQGSKPLTAVTNASGKFTTQQMPYGSCVVEIAAQGFATFRTKVVGAIDASPEVNATLQPGAMSGPIHVAEQAPLATATPTVTSHIGEPPVRDAANRNWEFGAFVQGGVGLEDRTNFGFFTLGGHAGRVLSDEHLNGALRGNFEYAVEAMPFWQSYTPTFQRITCPAGATSASQCSAPYTVGGTFTGLSVTPIILRWNFTHGKRVMPFVQGAGGVLFTTKKYPAIGNLDYTDPTQTGLNADTSQINFTPQGGIGMHYFLRQQRSVDVALNAVHISSASLGDKNPGVNASLQFSIGYTWWK